MPARTIRAAMEKRNSQMPLEGKETLTPATLAQAKKRWREHTRSVLSDDARAKAKQLTRWTVGFDRIPRVFLGLFPDQMIIRFDRRVVGDTVYIDGYWQRGE